MQELTYEPYNEHIEMRNQPARTPNIISSIKNAVYIILSLIVAGFIFIATFFKKP